MILKAHQAINVDKCVNIPSSFDMSETRTGKSFTALGIIQKTLPNLVVLVTPLGIVKNEWLNKLKLLDGYTIIEYKNDTCLDNLSNFVVIVMGYGTFSHSSGKEKIRDFTHKVKSVDLLIIDEVHKLKNRNSVSFKTMKILRNIAKRVHLMSATPIVNGLFEIFSYLYLLDYKTYTSYWKFVDHYFDIQTRHLGSRKIREVLDFKNKWVKKELIDIVDYYSCKSTREVFDIKTNLEIKRLHIPATKSQIKYYNLLKFDNEFIAPNGETVDCWNDAPVLSKLLKFRQISSSAEVFGIDNNKSKILIGYCEKKQERVIIYSLFTRYLNILFKTMKDKGLNVVLYTGEMSPKRKKIAETKFKEEKNCILLANVISLNTGATLDMCDTIFFNDLPQSYTLFSQAKDRIVAPVSNQTKTLKKIYILENSLLVDSKMYELIIDKKKSYSCINNYKDFI